MMSIIMLIMGMLGILFYTVFKAKEYIITDNFIMSVFLKENLAAWLWAFSVLVLAWLTLYFEPEANQIIVKMVGLDLANTKPGWLVFGAGLCGLIRNVKK